VGNDNNLFYEVNALATIRKALKWEIKEFIALFRYDNTKKVAHRLKVLMEEISQ
jgi:hypothetical protein